jgi:hypothetical protein
MALTTTKARSCNDKQNYPSKSSAMNAMRRLKKRGGFNLHIYRCDEHWHVGHRRGKRRAGNTDAW